MIFDLFFFCLIAMAGGTTLRLLYSEGEDDEAPCGNCEYCCINGTRCGTKDECNRTKIIFAAVLGSIFGLLLLLLILWGIVVAVNRCKKNHAIRNYNKKVEQENKFGINPEQKEKSEGIVIGIPITSQAPVCQATFKSEFVTQEELMNNGRTRAGSNFDRTRSRANSHYSSYGSNALPFANTFNRKLKLKKNISNHNNKEKINVLSTSPIKAMNESTSSQMHMVSALESTNSTQQIEDLNNDISYTDNEQKLEVALEKQNTAHFEESLCDEDMIQSAREDSGDENNVAPFQVETPKRERKCSFKAVRSKFSQHFKNYGDAFFEIAMKECKSPIDQKKRKTLPPNVKIRPVLKNKIENEETDNLPFPSSVLEFFESALEKHSDNEQSTPKENISENIVEDFQS